MSILPPEVRAGYVYDRVLRAIGDRPYDDDRLPDGIPAQGRVIFRPKTSVKQVVSGGRGVTVTREPVTCTIHQGEDQPDDPDPTKGGLLIDEAGAVGGVWLVVGEWTVEYHMEDRYSNIPNEEIIVTEEHTKENPLDVALASELTPTPTQKFVVNEQIYVDTLAARDEVQDNLHNMVISGEVVGDDLQLSRHGGDTIVAGNVRGPRGPQGIQGPMGTLELIGGDNPAITVDTSVGERVSIGDLDIFYSSGWRDMRGLVDSDNWDFDFAGSRFSLKRKLDTVELVLRVRIGPGYAGSSKNLTLTLLTGLHSSFQQDPPSYGTLGVAISNREVFSITNGSSSGGIYITSDSEGRWELGQTLSIYTSWNTDSSLPRSFPGTPV